MRVIFTCGGSAGHVNPALAVAQVIEQRHPGSQILFVGAERGMEQRLVERAGYPIEAVKVSTFERQLSWTVVRHNVKSLFKIPVGRHQARAIVKRFQPDLVMGTGGYASFPAIAEAARLGIPTAIHESNVSPGLTTKALAGKVDLVMVGFPEAAAYYPNAKRVEVTGTPVRGDFFRLTRQEARAQLRLQDDRPLVVSFWGSLGARFMNEHTVDFLTRWDSAHRPFHYIHSGGRNYQEMVDALAQKGCTVGQEVLRPYIDNMPVVMAAADLVICRAGASTLGELTALGKPCILIPSPFVAGNHQLKNAKVLEQRGGAKLLEEKDCTGQRLLELTQELLADVQGRRDMERRLKELAAPQATQTIYEHLMSLL